MIAQAVRVLFSSTLCVVFKSSITLKSKWGMSLATLADKMSAGITLRHGSKNVSEGIHPGIETQRRYYQIF